MVIGALGFFIFKNGGTPTSPLTIPEPSPPSPAGMAYGPGDYQRDLPSWPNRSYTLHIPSNYDSSRPVPVVVVIHGGGGNSKAAAQLTCPGGNINDSKCFNKLADKEGFVVVYPNGTPEPGSSDSGRRWSVGGGKNGYSCAGGFTCAAGIDDIKYFRDLLDDVESVVNTDRARIFTTGLSNGGSMSHRLACQLADHIAAIAPLGGGNQFSTVEPCVPGRAVPVIHIHGTDDSWWPYMGGSEGRATGPGDKGVRISIPQTMSGWASRNGCNATPTIESLPDIAKDGTSVTRETYTRCKDNGDVIHYKITGGGHTWPQGYQYLREFLIGRTSQDINANEIIWDFFKAHPKR